MRPNGWKDNRFEEKDVIHLCTKNKDVLAENNRRILSVGNPIVLVQSKNRDKASVFCNDRFNGLALSMYLCVGVNIQLTVKYLNIGLSNSSTGNIKEIFYDENHMVLELPRVVFVDFGAQYTGESFFPNDPSRSGWFPIYPVENKCYTPDKNLMMGSQSIHEQCYY